MKKFFSFIAAVLFAGSMSAGVYVKATSIAAGDVVVLASPDVLMELSGISTTSTKYGTGVAFTGAPAGVFTLTVEAGTAENSFAFKTSDSKYLTWTSGNSLNVAADKSANTSWTVTIDSENGQAAIVNVADATRQIWWNVNSPRFAAYTNKSHGDGYKCPSLYVEGEAPAVAEPVIGPIATLFYEEVEISIECETEGATIYYTINGADPDANSYQYVAPFSISSSLTIKAIAIKGEDASSIASKTYTAGVAQTVADALAALDDRTYIANQFVIGTICSVDFFNETYHSISYKLSDDGTEENALTVYSGKGLNGADFESIEDLKVGSKVVVLGDLTVFNGTKEFQQTSKIVKIISVPTAIDNTDAAAKAVKFFENGQLIILKNGVRYNAQGAIVK